MSRYDAGRHDYYKIIPWKVLFVIFLDSFHLNAECFCSNCKSITTWFCKEFSQKQFWQQWSTTRPNQEGLGETFGSYIREWISDDACCDHESRHITCWCSWSQDRSRPEHRAFLSDKKGLLFFYGASAIMSLEDLHLTSWYIDPQSYYLCSSSPPNRAGSYYWCFFSHMTWESGSSVLSIFSIIHLHSKLICGFLILEDFGHQAEWGKFRRQSQYSQAEWGPWFELFGAQESRDTSTEG